jgi:N-acetylmuramic acid 6-phosphate (MurNAc-6-P) etherase/N-acetylglucosamine kinase-like BadF-type ATPase
MSAVPAVSQVDPYEDLTICIDGGGSKTALQILDSEGRILSLFRDGGVFEEIRVGASNINSVGPAGVKATLETLFKDVKVGEDLRDLKTLIGKCTVVAGMAGIGTPQNRETVTTLLEEWGVRRENLRLMTDADLGLQLLSGHGAILIAGTGSICLGTKDGHPYRVGGLGPVLGDEGSGYQVGLEAMKAALAEEYGWGEPTAMTAAFREYFGVAELKSLIRDITLREIPVSRVAGLVPIVFAKAKEKDRVALAIVQQTGEELKKMLATMLKISGLANCEIHLWGGLFKSPFADSFSERLNEELNLKGRNIHLVNQSQQNPALLFARLLQREKGNVARLQPGVLPFDTFMKNFHLGELSTEQPNPTTASVSQVMHENTAAGLKMLLEVEKEVILGFEKFIPRLSELTPQLTERISEGGRVFLVGSGSSGRIAIDLAAKCSLAFPERRGQIEGVIAGGDSAFIRAREGFEDSEADGMACLNDKHLGPKDTVILISASGSASFNVGCGKFASEKGAQTLYFFNSAKVPARTQALFQLPHNPVIPLLVDIGAPAIPGSTRLQPATLAIACLGSLLGGALHLDRKEEIKAYPEELLAKMKMGLALISERLQAIADFVERERAVLADPNSNFRRLRDETQQGYITFVASKEALREVLIDATETSPTFSTNPIRREGELQKRRAEFRAYALGKDGWGALLEREPSSDTRQFLLATEDDGQNAFRQRPLGKGNFLVGVTKLDESEEIPQALFQILVEHSPHPGIILTCKGRLSEAQRKGLEDLNGPSLALEQVPSDSMGLVETMVLKQVLNLISNGSMIQVNKVYGNQMIDVRASNHKLIDRCMRLVKDIWKGPPLNDRDLYYLIVQVQAIKKAKEEQGIYSPSIVKIVLAMLYFNKRPEQFQESVDFLLEMNERMDWITKSRYSE